MALGHKIVTPLQTNGFPLTDKESLTGFVKHGILITGCNFHLDSAMIAKAVWLGVAVAILVCLSFIYLWREWAAIAVIVVAVLLMGGFMSSRRGGAFIQAIYGGSVIGIACAG
jgi:hypothetical protein